MGNHRFRHREAEHHLALNVPPSRKEVVMRRRRVTLTSAEMGRGRGRGPVGRALPPGTFGTRPSARSTAYAVGQFELVTNGAITAPAGGSRDRAAS